MLSNFIFILYLLVATIDEGKYIMNDYKIIESILLLSNKCISEKNQKDVLGNMSTREASILISINSEEEITGNELALKNKLSSSRMSRIIDKLFKKGYIFRKSNKEDRRYHLISLTKKGIKQRDVIMQFNKKCEDELIKRLKREDLNIVQKALGILLKTFEENGDEY